MKGCSTEGTELDLAIARSCWGGWGADSLLVAGGLPGGDVIADDDSAGLALLPSENFAQPVCDAKDADKDEAEEEEGDDFDDEDEDDEDEEFEGEDEFEDDDDEFFDGDDDDEEFGDDMDDEDEEDEDF
jgi:hypothetical protein